MGSKVGLCTVRFLTTKFMHICMQTVRCPGPDLQQKCVLLFLQSGGQPSASSDFFCATPVSRKTHWNVGVFTFFSFKRAKDDGVPSPSRGCIEQAELM